MFVVFVDYADLVLCGVSEFIQLVFQRVHLVFVFHFDEPFEIELKDFKRVVKDVNLGVKPADHVFFVKFLIRACLFVFVGFVGGFSFFVGFFEQFLVSLEGLYELF